MKLKKKLVIVLLLFQYLSISYAQESNLKNTEIKKPDLNNTVNLSEKVPDKSQDIEKKMENKSEAGDSIKKKITAHSSKSTNQKTAVKPDREKKNKSASEDVKTENINQEKNQGDLLLINEGNFKYKRIPDIKLIDKKPAADTAAVNNATTGNTQNLSDTAKTGGLFGLGKTASDIIVKGGTLLLILLIFILYKSRMSVPRGKSSKSRKVLNSFRK
jgi:hypothetical protein